MNYSNHAIIELINETQNLICEEVSVTLDSSQDMGNVLTRNKLVGKLHIGRVFSPWVIKKALGESWKVSQEFQVRKFKQNSFVFTFQNKEN